MSTRIVEMRATDYKKIKAVRIVPPAGERLVKLIGKNEAGKTSVLDAIKEMLRGRRGGAEMPVRSGEPEAEGTLVLSNGMTIKRKWTAEGRDTLVVTNAEGWKLPGKQQQTLDGLYGAIAFDPLEFARMKPADQAAMLAEVVGLDFTGYVGRRGKLTDERKALKKSLETAKAQLEGTAQVADPPNAEVNWTDLVAELTAAQRANLESHNDVEAKRKAADEDARAAQELRAELGRAEIERKTRIADLDAAIEAATKKRDDFRDRSAKVIEEQTAKHAELDAAATASAKAAEAAIAGRVVVDVEPINAKIASAEENNKKFRQHKVRLDKIAECAASATELKTLDERIDAIQTDMDDIVSKKELPVPGLKLTLDGVYLDGKPFSQSSGAQRTKTSAVIGLAKRPELNVMLIDEATSLDNESLAMLEGIAEEYDAYIWMARADVGQHEAGVFIVDGETEGAAELFHAEDVASGKVKA